MTELDSSPAVSSETDELATELQQERPDSRLIKWLVEDMRADVQAALTRAHISENDLKRKPHLCRLGLQKYLH